MFFLFSLAVLVGCEKLEWILSDPEQIPSEVITQNTFEFELDSFNYVTSNEVLERAYKMASVDWTPVNPVPKTRKDGL